MAEVSAAAEFELTESASTRFESLMPGWMRNLVLVWQDSAVFDLEDHEFVGESEAALQAASVVSVVPAALLLVLQYLVMATCFAYPPDLGIRMMQ